MKVIRDRSRSVDVDAFLARPHFAHLATASDDGPRESPVWFLWEDEAIWIIGSRLTDTFPARIEREPRCALGVVDLDLSSGLVEHVGMRGRASVQPFDPGRARMLLARYLGRDETAWDRRFRQALQDPDNVLIRFEPETVVARDLSYSVARVPGRLERGAVRRAAPPYRGEGPHALWHVSEDAKIRRFEPHRAATSLHDEPRVWAIDTRHLPLYWFPRDCPRGTFWAGDKTTDEDVERFLGHDRTRVHAIEGSWLDRVRAAHVVAYRLPEAPFQPDPEVGGYWIARGPVEPLEVVELGDLLARHAEAEIELRIVPRLGPLWERVIASSLEFSGMRLANADRTRDSVRRAESP